ETPPQPSASIPFSRDSDFVNRGDILDQIDRQCSKPAGRVALVGLGGVGKSQLAIEYTHRIAEAQTKVWVFWIHAGTQARVEESFRTIADTVELSGRNEPKADIPLLVQNWLSNERNSRWIVVLDSADDHEVLYGLSEEGGNRRLLASYLPQSRNGSIIVTTRNKDLACRITGSRNFMIEVGPMTQADAITLLEKKLGFADVNTATDLVQALDCVPLAISQAAAYIKAREPRSSVGKYLAEFRESERKRTRLLEHDGGDLRRDGGASNAILTTWRISFDYIRHKRPSAADLLSLMSFFDRQGIPEWVLEPAEKIKSTGRAGWQDEARDSDSDSCNETDSIDNGFEDDVAMLRDYCLIDMNREGDEFEMHGLVQLTTRKWLSLYGQQETFEQQCIERLAARFPTGQYENWATCQKLFLHVQKAVDYKPEENRIVEWATLLYKGGWYAWLQGRYDIAERMVSKSRKARIKMLGVEDDASLASTSLFASVLRDQGRWEEAEKLFVQVMETRKNKLGADHPSTLTSMANLASTFWNRGRWEEAEKLEVQVMETRKNKLGADHPDTLTSMANLACTWKSQGRDSDALAMMKDCVQAQQRILGQKHPNTLSSLETLEIWTSSGVD
ncbi:P-loop containing nucleoside triphosphate hydrolase protein, partial [Stachybotrys elegans]